MIEDGEQSTSCDRQGLIVIGDTGRAGCLCWYRSEHEGGRRRGVVVDGRKKARRGSEMKSPKENAMVVVVVVDFISEKGSRICN